MTDGAPLVLITGAAGRIGTALRSALSQYRLRLHDRDLRRVELKPNEEAVECDLADFAGIRQAVEGCDAVIHLAGDPRPSASWWELRSPNIDGPYHVFEAARQAGVRRLVFATTNHVTGMLDQRGEWPISPAGELAPDSLYGVTKAFGEALGRYYAENSDLSVVCLRIGWFHDRELVDNPDWLRMWISEPDLGRLFNAAVTADVKFGIYYGVSNNTPMRYDLSNVRAELGYEPQDDSARVRAAAQSQA